MNVKLLCSLPIAALFLVGTSRADAMSFTTFQTKDAFERAVGANRLSTQDFDSIEAPIDFRNSSVAVGELTLSDTSGFRAIIGRASATLPTLNINNTPLAQLSARDTNGAAIAFNSSITAFGATFAAISDGGRDTRFVFEDGSNLAIPFRGAGMNLADNGFFGFVASDPVRSFSFRRFDGAAADGFSVDNISFGTAQKAPSQAVPTPALLPGLIGMGIAAIKRKAKASKSE